jgi:7-carboxy-7-deazaguanine synthase
MTELLVNEIFHSIQGESTQAGRPCVFIRLTYCNLRCTWCDTEYAFEEGERMSLDAIIRRVKAFACPLVEVTGGEPLVQEGSLLLMHRLCDEGFETLLETGGSLDISSIDPRVRKIVDVKCPGSGMEKKNLWSNIAFLGPSDEVKCVIADRRDFEWAVDVVRRHQLTGRCPVLFSPVFGELHPLDLSRWVLESGLPIRVQLQLHKYIWEPETRGV